MKFNKKMLFGAIASLIAAIFGIIAFFALKYRASGAENLGGATLTDWGKLTSNDTASAIYGCGVAGLVFAFIAIVFPVVSMFYSNENLDKAFGWLSIAFAVLGFVLMLASVAVYAGKATLDGKALYSKGYVAGQFIFVIVGGLLAIAGNAVSYKSALTK